MPHKLDTICRTPICCPGCGRKTRERLRTLMEDSEIECACCGNRIDISARQTKAVIQDIANSIG